MRSTLLRVTMFLIVVACMVSIASAQQPKQVTIPQLQQIPIDSLRKLDTLQSNSTGNQLDKSLYWHTKDANADTVQITGVVMVKPGILTYTLARYNIYVQDTTTGQLWAGINVLTDDTLSNAQSTGITALDTGMVVTLTGRVTEYGTQNNSLTEMFLYKLGFYQGQPSGIVQIGLGTIIPRPAAKEITLDSLSTIGGPGGAGGTPKPSSGEKYESMYVIVRNVTVVSVDYSTGRFTFQDSAGRTGYMYDGSGWYTIRNHKLSGSKYSPPPVGTKLSYIRGLVLPQQRTGTCGDYTIMPVYPGPSQKTGSTYPGDIGIASYAPQLSNISRTPSPPGPTATVTVKYKAKNLNPGGVIDSSYFNYQPGRSSAWVKVKIAADAGAGDSLYTATIPAANGDSLVSYYAQAYGSGTFGAYPDPSIPYFYQVRGTAGSLLSIKDIQYTPYVNGRPGFVGDTVTVSGHIIADTSDIKEYPSQGLGANRWRLWFSSGRGAWNGICIWGNTIGVGVDTLKKGDSVQVTGIVSNLNSRNNIQVLSYTFIQRGVTLPVIDTLSMFKPDYFDYQLSNMPVVGTGKFHQWVGQLVQFNNMYVVRLNADNLAVTGTNTYGEFLVSNVPLGTSEPYGMRVDDNGTNNYFADSTRTYQTKFAAEHPYSPPKNLPLHVGDKISFLRGILDMSYSAYKLEPRQNSDYGSITTSVQQEPNVQPTTYELSQNYPNPFNPTTTIRYAIPAAASVRLMVYNLLGQEVQTLVDQRQNAGAYVVTFDASRLSTGVYFYRLKADNFSTVKKMLLLK